MLEHLRNRAAAGLAQPRTVTLATCGPADLQCEALPCRALDQCLYLLIPRASDQLLNIEHREGVLVTAQGWQLRGSARILPDNDVPAALRAERLPEAAWSAWVVVTPMRLTLLDAHQKPLETIDFA